MCGHKPCWSTSFCEVASACDCNCRRLQGAAPPTVRGQPTKNLSAWCCKRTCIFILSCGCSWAQCGSWGFALGCAWARCSSWQSLNFLKFECCPCVSICLPQQGDSEVCVFVIPLVGTCNRHHDVLLVVMKIVIVTTIPLNPEQTRTRASKSEAGNLHQPSNERFRKSWT